MFCSSHRSKWVSKMTKKPRTRDASNNGNNGNNGDDREYNIEGLVAEALTSAPFENDQALDEFQESFNLRLDEARRGKAERLRKRDEAIQREEDDEGPGDDA